MAEKKTAKKKVTKKKAVRRRTLTPRVRPRRVVTIKQITDALYGIENWCRSLREILLLLPPGMTIMLSGQATQGSAGGGVPQGLDYGCPPPIPADGGGGLDYGCPPPPPEE